MDYTVQRVAESDAFIHFHFSDVPYHQGDQSSLLSFHFHTSHINLEKFLLVSKAKPRAELQ